MRVDHVRADPTKESRERDPVAEIAQAVKAAAQEVAMTRYWCRKATRRIRRNLRGLAINSDALTGTKTAYGAGGYEFFLNNRPVQTSGEYKVQLRDQNGTTPLSDQIAVDTFADCSKNLLLVNFVQNH